MLNPREAQKIWRRTATVHQLRQASATKPMGWIVFSLYETFRKPGQALPEFEIWHFIARLENAGRLPSFPIRF